jgi:hypothetical protein
MGSVIDTNHDGVFRDREAKYTCAMDEDWVHMVTTPPVEWKNDPYYRMKFLKLYGNDYNMLAKLDLNHCPEHVDVAWVGTPHWGGPAEATARPESTGVPSQIGTPVYVESQNELLLQIASDVRAIKTKLFGG